MNKDKFIFAYQGTFEEDLNYTSSNTHSKYSGLHFLLSKFEQDNKIMDIRHVAYMLATVKRECGNEWQPIKEYSRGKGYKYGVPDPETGQVYYGRGYVQLTWKYNYKFFGKLLNVDLLNEPDLALEPDIAYEIMSFGMRNGSFTGVGLNKFINIKGCDYVNARKIINGLDCAKMIAKNAICFENVLRYSIQ